MYYTNHYVKDGTQTESHSRHSLYGALGDVDTCLEIYMTAEGDLGGFVVSKTVATHEGGNPVFEYLPPGGNMSDPLIAAHLMETLASGPVVVASEGGLRDAVGLPRGISKNQTNRAMGRLITDGRVNRSRPEPQGIDRPERPITYRLRFS